MKEFPISDYAKAGCRITNMTVAMELLYEVTKGQVCNGCPKYKNPDRCTAHRNLVNNVDVSKPPRETVRAEAKRRGTSISEVRRQRTAA